MLTFVLSHDSTKDWQFEIKVLPEFVLGSPGGEGRTAERPMAQLNVHNR